MITKQPTSKESSITYTDLVKLCLTTPRTPKPIRDAAEQLQRESRPGPAASYTDEQAERVRDLRRQSFSIRDISTFVYLSPSIVARICKTSPQIAINPDSNAKKT